MSYRLEDQDYGDLFSDEVRPKIDPSLLLTLLASLQPGAAPSDLGASFRALKRPDALVLGPTFLTKPAEFGFFLDADGAVGPTQEKRDGEPPTADGAPPFFFEISLQLSRDAGDDPRRTLQSLATAVGAADVERIELSPLLASALDFSIPAIRARPGDLPAAPERLDGTGVMVGVVDFGCDFAHANFRHGDGRSRLVWLWDQNDGQAPEVPQPPGSPTPPYGRLYGAAIIDAALQESDPYWALGYDPNQNDYGGNPAPLGAHGTAVMDVAAGNGRATHNPGVAPGADLVFVHLRPQALLAKAVGQTGGRVLDAVLFVLLKAQERAQPCVVNLSLAANGGPHDGTSVLEQAFETVLNNRSDRAIVICAGNMREARMHASGEVTDLRPSRIDFKLPPKGGPARVAIWYTPPAGRTLLLTLVAPDGTDIVIPDGYLGPIFEGGNLLGWVAASWPHSDPATHAITLLLRRPSAMRHWGVSLSFPPNPTPLRARFDAWIERDDASQAVFVDRDADPRRSLNGIACGTQTIIVGASYEIVKPATGAFFSSVGPTRNGGRKPDICAPGYQIRAARSKGKRQPTKAQPEPTAFQATGTSLSAPHVSGLAALMLQKSPGAPPGTLLTTINDNAVALGPESPPAPAWNPLTGFGQIDAAETVDTF